MSNVWSYTTLQNQINTLSNEKNNLQSQVNTLQSQIDSLNATYQDYVASHSHSNSEYDDLNTAYQNYMATHSMTNSEYNALIAERDALKAEKDALKAPKLSTLSLYADDVRPWLGTPRLHIYGEVWNVGTDTAYNCKLHVVAYQGAVKAIDTYVSLGTISGENRKSVDSNIYYSGSALTSWSITAVGD